MVHNTDIISDIPLGALMDGHQKHKPLATLAVMDRPSSRVFLLDEENVLHGWKNLQSGEGKKSRNTLANLHHAAFCGIQVIDPRIFPLIEEEGIFSIVDLYLRLAKEELIVGMHFNQSTWFDLGKVEEIAKAGAWLQQA